MRAWHSSGNNFQIPLSQKEILEINNEINKEFSPKKPLKPLVIKDNLPLSRQELLEVSENISLYYAPKTLSRSKSLVLHSIDPQHLYVFGGFDEYQINDYSQNNAETEWTLKVFSQNKESGGNVEQKIVYEKPVYTPQFQQKIDLPKSDVSTVYTASIGKSVSKNVFVPLVKSNKTAVFHKPAVANFYEKHDIKPDTIPLADSHDLDYRDVFLDEENCPTEKPYSVKSHHTNTQFSGRGKKKR